MTSSKIATFVFDSTNGALWAEDIARTRGVPVEVVPAPPGSDALCDLAIEAFRKDAETLRTAWGEEGVPYRDWESEG